MRKKQAVESYLSEIHKVIFQKQAIVEAFISYFGEEYRSLFTDFSSLSIHFYSPSKAYRVSRSHLYQSLKRELQCSFFTVFFRAFSIPFRVETLVAYLNCKQEVELLQTFFGDAFLQSFDMSSFLQSPLFSFPQKVEAYYQTFLNDSFDTHEAFLKGMHFVRAHFDDFAQIFSLYSQYERVIEAFSHFHHEGAKMVDSFYFENPSWREKLFASDFVRSCNGALQGREITTSRWSMVAISLFAPLQVLVHELGHYFLNDVVCAFPDQNFFSLFFGLRKEYHLQGIFEYDHLPQMITMEAFHEYFIHEVMKQPSMQVFSSFPYLLDSFSSYDKLAYGIQLFMDRFEPLMKYATMHHMPKLVWEVVGHSYFEEFCHLCYQVYYTKGEMSLERKEKFQSLIGLMEEHAKMYFVGYEDAVHSYLQSCQMNGQTVRVLKPGMDALHKQEQVIRDTLLKL